MSPVKSPATESFFAFLFFKRMIRCLFIVIFNYFREIQCGISRILIESFYIYIFWITWKQICGDNFIFFKDLWEEVTEVIGMATFGGHVGHGWLRDRRMSNVTHIRSLSRVRSKNILRLSFVFCSDYTI